MSNRISLLFLCLAASTGAARADAITQTVFATGAAVGSSGPDSIAVGNGSVWVAYSNGASSTGTAGASTVLQYNMSGAVLQKYTVAGYVDGLKINPADGKVWVLQNQDGNSTLTIVDPATNTVGAPIPYAVTSTSRGYDDVVFKGNQTFLSYTNPANPTDPTIQALQNGSNPLVFSSTVLAMGATGVNLATGQTNQLTSQNDPDSLNLTPTGGLVLTSGDDGQLIFVDNPGGANAVSFLQLLDPSTQTPVSGLDDAIYATAPSGTFYLSDTKNNQVLAIHATGLTTGSLFASVGSLNEFGLVNMSTGDVTPLLSGLNGPHGAAFIADTPEPGGAATALIGLVLMGAITIWRRVRIRAAAE